MSLFFNPSYHTGMESTDPKLFQVHFGVGGHEVSVVTAVSSLMSVADILKEIGTSAGEEKVDVSIYAPERGSVVFSVLVATIPLVTSALPAIKIAVDYAKTLVDVIDIAKLLKGERPKTITLEAKNGSTITNIADVKGNVYVINGDVKLGAELLASNPLVQKSVKTLGEAAKRDPALDSLTFSVQGEKHPIEKDEFEYLEKAGEETEEIQEEHISNALLTIIRPSFLQNLKSDFYYQGFKIACTIQDTEFYKEIDAGKKFSKGDVLECEMTIKKKLESATNTYLNHSYTVTKVTKHHPRAETQRLEL